MFIRSKKRNIVAKKKPTITKTVKPEKSEIKEVSLELPRVKTSIIKPESGLKFIVEENKGEDE